MAKTQKQIKGEKAEQLAVEYYETKGFEVVERNYRWSRAEIDLIIMKPQLLVFVEVKYRTNMNYGNPEDFVSPNQQRSIIEAADDYIHAINWVKDIRFDIIAINRQNQLEHFEDAFY
ncbi:MAG: YraN family protein [Cyclobacteriaceae bacterium]